MRGNKTSPHFEAGNTLAGALRLGVITQLLLLLEYIISQRLLQPWLNKSVVIPLVRPGGFVSPYLTRLIKTLPCLAFSKICIASVRLLWTYFMKERAPSCKKKKKKATQNPARKHSLKKIATLCDN